MAKAIIPGSPESPAAGDKIRIAAIVIVVLTMMLLLTASSFHSPESPASMPSFMLRPPESGSGSGSGIMHSGKASDLIDKMNQTQIGAANGTESHHGRTNTKSGQRSQQASPATSTTHTDIPPFTIPPLPPNCLCSNMYIFNASADGSARYILKRQPTQQDGATRGGKEDLPPHSWISSLTGGAPNPGASSSTDARWREYYQWESCGMLLPRSELTHQPPPIVGPYWFNESLSDEDAQPLQMPACAVMDVWLRIPLTHAPAYMRRGVACRSGNCSADVDSGAPLQLLPPHPSVKWIRAPPVTSVCLVVFQSASTLRRVLLSLLHLTRGSWELIVVVDSDSKGDASLAVARRTIRQVLKHCNIDEEQTHGMCMDVDPIASEGERDDQVDAVDDELQLFDDDDASSRAGSKKKRSQFKDPLSFTSVPVPIGSKMNGSTPCNSPDPARCTSTSSKSKSTRGCINPWLVHVRLLLQPTAVWETSANNLAFRAAYFASALADADASATHGHPSTRFLISVQDDQPQSIEGWNERLTMPFHVRADASSGLTASSNITTRNHTNATANRHVEEDNGNDLLSVSARCAHTLYSRIPNGNNKVGRCNADISLPLPTDTWTPSRRCTIFIRDTCNRGPLAFDARKPRDMGFLDELHFRQDRDDHDLHARAWKTHRWKTAFVALDWYPQGMDGASRKHLHQSNEIMFPPPQPTRQEVEWKHARDLRAHQHGSAALYTIAKEARLDRWTAHDEDRVLPQAWMDACLKEEQRRRIEAAEWDRMRKGQAALETGRPFKPRIEELEPWTSFYVQSLRDAIRANRSHQYSPWWPTAAAATSTNMMSSP